MKNRLLQFLNIRSEEAWLVTNLFWLQFFQGFGVAIFYIVSLTLFLEHCRLTGLPKAYMMSALILWIAGYTYSKLEHALPVKNLALGIILFIAFSIAAFWLTYSGNNESSVVIFWMFCWFNVIYLLGNLEFWGLAALMFDIRQSKRLFGIIGMGDVPGKLIGYSAVTFTFWVKFISNETLLLVSFISILCSLVFYFRLKRAGKLDLHVKHEHAPIYHAHGSKDKLINFIKSFFGNKMLASVAGLSFIVLTCITIISFSFYDTVEHEAHSNEQLASFIGLFYFSGKVIAILIRLILTGRLSNVLGVKGSLLLSPILLLAFLFGIILLPFLTHHDEYFMLCAFGLMMVLSEVLKTSLQDPIFLSLMQPLPTHMRLKGHTLVKGVMDPFALAFSGFMLYGLVKLSGGGEALLYILSYLLLVLVIIWIVAIFVVDREYVKTLITALNKRYSVGQEIDLLNEQTRQVLENKIAGGEIGEAIYILNLIEKQYSDDQEELVIKALEHPQSAVKMEAIKLAERKKIIAALPKINELIETRSDIHLLPEAVKAKCMLLPDELESFDEFLNDSDHRLMKAAITGLMTSGGISAMVTAGQRLLQLIPSTVSAERKMAAEIIGDLAVQSFYKPLLQLLNDENDEVVRAAIHACGQVKNEKLIRPLIDMFRHRKYEKIVMDALETAGDISLKEIQTELGHEKFTRLQQSKLILLCGRIGTDNASKILDALMWQLPQLRTDIFHALYLCEFKSQPHNRQQHIDLMTRYINAAIKILFSIHELQDVKTTKILVDALYLELNEIRDSMLLLFSFVYNKEKMIRAKNAFLLNKKESIANALEVIEIEVPKEISLKFAKIFEPGNVSDKCAELKPYFKEELSYELIIDMVIHDKQHHFHRWTKAAALHSLIFYKGTQKRDWLESAEKENDILLKETAQKILAELS